MKELQIIKEALLEVVARHGWKWPEKAVIEVPKDSAHGDAATNLAMTLAGQAKASPRNVAETIRADLLQACQGAFAVEIAGPGFINFTFPPSFWQQVINEIEEQGDAFGSSDDGRGRRIVVEYVSANPTGPLHIGHGRGAAVGDSLTRLLRFAGYDVTT